MPALVKRIELQESGAYVNIGIQEEAAKDKKTVKIDGIESTPMNALKLVDVATFHEFGTATIPQRSFIRSNDHNNYKTYKKLIEELKDKIIFGEMKPAIALGLLGEKIRLDIQASIRKGLKPDIKKATKDAKGSSTPLVDTGQLINGITYVVKGVKEGK